MYASYFTLLVTIYWRLLLTIIYVTQLDSLTHLTLETFFKVMYVASSISFVMGTYSAKTRQIDAASQRYQEEKKIFIYYTLQIFLTEEISRSILRLVCVVPLLVVLVHCNSKRVEV